MQQQINDRWKRVEAALDDFYRHVLDILVSSRLEQKDSNIFYQAVVGKKVAFYSRIERVIVTELGTYAPMFFRPFFDNVSDLNPPFDFKGYINGKLYYVKVVAGDRAFNSSVKRTVEDASRDFREGSGNIVILTLQGKRFDPVKVGFATWYDAEASWRIVAGPNSYSVFRNMVYNVANRYREKIWNVIQKKKDTYTNRRAYSSSSSHSSSSPRSSNSSSSSSSSGKSSSSSNSSSSNSSSMFGR
ncbi:hypothetical protein [Thermofilum sp.]|jgi:uncharacterized membrane protein YgcG|uniref:hypothetical protein n=1 Tax=Thermofilum sp. TaxID=1961369 RepID=UPI00258B170F|nr:hypothetical protein [Thermofilum sp.]